MHNDYRKDNRTDAEFEKDILEGHQFEREIVERYAAHVRQKYNVDVTITDNGVDNSGAIHDEGDCRADFLFNGKPLEIKYINQHADEFRFKDYQVLSYIQQNASVLLVNGWLTEEPTFTVIKPDKLKQIVATKKPKPFEPWGFKKCYFLKKYTFNWFLFTKR